MQFNFTLGIIAANKIHLQFAFAFGLDFPSVFENKFRIGHDVPISSFCDVHLAYLSATFGSGCCIHGIACRR